MSSASELARRAAVRRLLNCFLRESGRAVVPDDGGRGTIPLGHSDIAVTELSEGGRSFTGSGDVSSRLSSHRSTGDLIVELTYHSLIGNHDYGDRFWLQNAAAERTELSDREVVALVLDAVEPICAQVFPDEPWETDAIVKKFHHSIDTMARYLTGSPSAGESITGGRTRRAEQSMRTGHPFHPIPKGTEWGPNELARYAPELGAEFDLHWFAIADSALLEERVAADNWIPAVVAQRVPPGYSAIPSHPWQAEHLRRSPEVRTLLDDGVLIDLGALGPEVYATSSVRTVCDPSHDVMWKLPLHIRVTNSLRVNPLPEMRRAAEAARLITQLAANWPTEFQVLIETGYRTIDPSVGSSELIADLGVLFRRNPFAETGESPQVLAGLLDEVPGGRPLLLELVEQSGGDHREWLRRYLAVSLIPMLQIYDRDALSLEAHVQNCLLQFDDGWPTRTWVRDFEGTSVSRERGIGRSLPASSPLSGYTDREVWLRLVYHVVTNQVGHVIYVLARYGPDSEQELWDTAREVLADTDSDAARLLLQSPTVPAKGNLVTGFARPGVLPLYVDIANPLHRETAAATAGSDTGAAYQ